MRFKDRAEAGRVVAAYLERYEGNPGLLVLALPRGGVPVAYEVAQALHAPMELFLVRKLGVPGHEELAMGAIATGGVAVLNNSVVEGLGIPDEVVSEVAAREREELERRERVYRDGRPPPHVAGRIAILVDDGLATGSTMRAAVAALRGLQPSRIVVAVPVGSAETCMALRQEADEVVCARTPEPFHAVGLWYEDFRPTSDDEVRDLLSRATSMQPLPEPSLWPLP
jgi:predicted phosphoribosyltransferase